MEIELKREKCTRERDDPGEGEGVRVRGDDGWTVEGTAGEGREGEKRLGQFPGRYLAIRNLGHVHTYNKH